MAAALPAEGASAAERVQELNVTVMLNELRGRVDSLSPAALRETRALFDREDQAAARSDEEVREGLRDAYATLLKLDVYERLILLRYLKRQFTTELERRLFIIMDIVRHPDLDASTDVAAIDSQIRAEELRAQGMTNDHAALCAQFDVIHRLKRQRADASLARDTRKIEASNVPAEQRERQVESARRQRRLLDDSIASSLGNFCGAQASSANPTATPAVTALPMERPRLRYRLYSLDPPERLLLAEGAGVPPVSSGSWDRAHAGKAYAQQQAQTKQRKNSDDQRRGPELKAYDEVAAAGRQLAVETEQARTACAERQRGLVAVRDRLSAERASIGERQQAIEREVRATACAPNLNVAGCQFERSRILRERTQPLQLRLQQIEQEERAQAGSERLKAAAAACDRELADVSKRYQARVSDSATLMKMATAGANAPPPVLATYEALQPYDAKGAPLGTRTPGVGFLKWGLGMAGENAAAEQLLHHTGIRIDPLPPTPVSTFHVAVQLAKLNKVETNAGLACWGLDMYKIVATPMAEDSNLLQRMFESVLQLRSEEDPEFKPCPKH
ncbi:MAG: hypothetical protein M3Z16_00745 [Pseudomonadota bacterium]|nr:hypothetical protein [Pseudomonadota bacterium]